jgi:hypothetical protein
MRVYLASGLQNIERARQVRDWIAAAGHTITYDWMAHGPAGDRGAEYLTAIADRELQGVKDADCVVVLLPGGRGTHAELGAALALNKSVLVWDEEATRWVVHNGTCAFYWHPRVVRGCGDVGDAASELLARIAWAPWAVLPPKPLFEVFEEELGDAQPADAV